MQYRLFEPHPGPSDGEILRERAYRRLQHKYQEIEWGMVRVYLPLEDAMVQVYRMKVSPARADALFVLM